MNQGGTGTRGLGLVITNSLELSGSSMVDSLQSIRTLEADCLCGSNIIALTIRSYFLSCLFGNY